MPNSNPQADVTTDGSGSTGSDPLTIDDVRKVAELALLKPTDAELSRYRSQLNDVLDLAAQLESVDIEGLPPTSHPFGLLNVYRDDVAVTPTQEFSQRVLDCAPDVEDGQFKVPPALGPTETGEPQ